MLTASCHLLNSCTVHSEPDCSVLRSLPPRCLGDCRLYHKWTVSADLNSLRLGARVEKSDLKLGRRDLRSDRRDLGSDRWDWRWDLR